ncbi:HD domain-containing protein [Candidatus Gracilibacteria bacterium]|nr:HD domain-containing protein [Candidatus Gracilibacteria bacterium]
MNVLESKIICDAKKYVNSILMPLENYYYHQYEHALDVMTRAVYIGEKEGLSKEDIEIMAISGLFHDTGFTIQYDNNEFIGAKIAENYLKSILYPKEKIDKVRKIIQATDSNYDKPENIMEKIIKDSDLDNLGRDDFFDKGDKLKMELETIKKIKIKDPDWHHSALDFLWNHRYYTKTQENERGEKKKKNEELLKSMVKEEGEVVIKPNY